MQLGIIEMNVDIQQIKAKMKGNVGLREREEMMICVEQST